MASEGDPDAVPEEIEETCVQCHEALAGVERLLKPVLAVSRSGLEDKVRCVCADCSCILQRELLCCW